MKNSCFGVNVKIFSIKPLFLNYWLWKLNINLEDISFLVSSKNRILTFKQNSAAQFNCLQINSEQNHSLFKATNMINRGQCQRLSYIWGLTSHPLSILCCSPSLLSDSLRFKVLIGQSRSQLWHVVVLLCITTVLPSGILIQTA